MANWIRNLLAGTCKHLESTRRIKGKYIVWFSYSSVFQRMERVLDVENRHAGVMELADVVDSKSTGLITRAGSSPATGTMSSVHNATEHSYVKEQSKGCSFAISMGRSAPVERLSGRSVFFTRPCRQDTQSPHPGGCPAPRSPGIPLPPANPGRR